MLDTSVCTFLSLAPFQWYNSTGAQRWSDYRVGDAATAWKLASYFNFFYSHNSTDAENMQVTTAVCQVHLNQEVSTITGLWWHHSWRTKNKCLITGFSSSENVQLKSRHVFYITVDKNEQLPRSHISLKGHIQMDVMVRGNGQWVLRPDQEVSHPSPTTTYDRLQFPRLFKWDRWREPNSETCRDDCRNDRDTRCSFILNQNL